MLNIKAKTLILIVGVMVVNVLITQITWLREHLATTGYSAVPNVTIFGGGEGMANRQTCSCFCSQPGQLQGTRSRLFSEACASCAADVDWTETTQRKKILGDGRYV